MAVGMHALKFTCASGPVEVKQKEFSHFFVDKPKVQPFAFIRIAP